MNNNSFVYKLPAGTYYIGDPCYVFNDDYWSDICNKLFANEDWKNMNKIVINETFIYMASTFYGDGEYKDQFMNSYPVDAGLLGIVPISIIQENNKISVDDIISKHLGVIKTFDSDFEVFRDEDGVFYFGDIIIDTSFENDKDDDEDEYLGWDWNEDEDERW